MNRQIRWLFFWLGLLGGLMLLAKPSAAQAPLDEHTLDRFMTAQMATQRVPGLALAIIQADQIHILKGYGAARANEPVTAQTQFLVASLSKSFTAVATMQLVETGKLDLDAPVQRYLPDFTLADPAATQQITVRQLLNQVSGLSDAGFPAMRLPAPKTAAERITSLRAARLVAPPGMEYHYFDINYQILARLVEVASGQPFSDYLQTHLFTPLQMTHTVNLMTSDDIAQKPTNLAQGHLLAYGLPIASGEESGFMGGSSGIVTTAEDMAHYLIMQTNGGRFQGKQLLSAQSVALLHTPPANLNSPYAMGWLTATTPSGVQHLEHNGILSTFYAEMVLLPETKQGFVLLYNIHSLAQDALGAPPIKDGLIDLLTGHQPKTGGFSVTTWAILMGVLTLLCVGLEMRGILRLSRWREQAATKPLWRHVLNIVWSFIPAVFVLAMPTIVLSSSGRAFGYLTLFRSMLDSLGWLGLCAVLGALNGLARLMWVLRRNRDADWR
ncbi:MAG: serine hydrolase domain-containing protein [Caldilineaceae bacterium]